MKAGVVHFLDRLGEPFLFLEERVVTVTTPEIRKFTNGLPKILFVVEGRIFHRFDEGRVEKLQAGDILINQAAFRQTYLPVSPPRASRIRVLRLTFAPDRESEFTRLILPRLPQKGVAACPLTLWVAEMRKELRSPRPDSRQRIHALARAALVDVARTFDAGRAETAAEGGERLCDAVAQHLDQHLSEPLTLADVARAVDRSEEHIARVFRQRRKRTIFAELQRLRIERAHYLLLCSELSMTAIARECGFSTPALFSRTFRARTGMSPTEWVARHR